MATIFFSATAFVTNQQWARHFFIAQRHKISRLWTISRPRRTSQPAHMERGQSPCVCSRRTSNRKVTEGDDCRLVYSSNLNAIVRARWPHLDSNHSETLSKPPFSKKLKLHLHCWLISNPNLHEHVHPDNAKTKNHCDTRENACKRAVMHTASFIAPFSPSPQWIIILFLD